MTYITGGKDLLTHSLMSEHCSINVTLELTHIQLLPFEHLCTITIHDISDILCCFASNMNNHPLVDVLMCHFN